jgi:hypothetical protein
MLKGVAKVLLIIGVAVLADQYFANGFYTDSALSMLKQIRHSFH